MANLNIPLLRLYNQNLTFQSFTKPQEVVSWFGAIQSQDFAAAKWALAIRTKNQTDQSIENAFNNGLVLRTHIMRPTWHFVTPEDIGWILELTAEKLHKFNGYYYRKSGLDKKVFDKSNDVIRTALQGANPMTRDELKKVLQQAKLPVEDMGLSYILMQAEIAGIICSGPKLGKQFSYMLLNERVKGYRKLERDEALAELTKRYFQSHGPAQIQDFTWWSSLSTLEAKKGLEMFKKELIKEEVDGKTYWYFDPTSTMKDISKTGFLVPGFDEYFIAYKDRSDILDKQYSKHLNLGGGMINGAIVVNGRMVGGWKRIIKKNVVDIKLQLLEKVSSRQHQSIMNAAKDYGKFHSLPVNVI